MSFISAFTLIHFAVGMHLVLSYTLLAAPARIASNGVVQMLGESMGFAPLSVSSMESSPAVTTFAGVLLGLLAFVDLVDLMAPTAAWRDRWEVQAPSRFMAFMALTAYAYIFKHRRTTRFVPLSAEEEKLAGVKTGVVFTWAFFEMIGWFWIYITLREEKRDAQLRLAQQRAEKEAMEHRY